MTFNLRRDTIADGANRWSRRREAVVKLLHDEAPHVVGTQEGLAHQLRDLDARLPWMRRVGSCRSGDGSDEHVALFYDPRRLLLVAWGDAWLSDTPELPGSRSWGNVLPRMMTWARLTDQETGESFTVVNTHLDHESAEAREQSAAYIDGRFPDAIVLGDFNDKPGSLVHEMMTKARRDAHADAPATATLGTYHAFRGAPRDLGRIDWVLAPAGVGVTGARVVTEQVDGRWPSDHFPVVADLVLAPRIGAPLAVAAGSDARAAR